MRLGMIVIAAALILASVFAPAFAHAEPKVIILGFDGMDPVLTQKFMDEGLMPNASKLAAQGHYSKLATSNPSASPVAWSSFAVGGNAARHGIFDFLRRMPGSYYPEFAMVTPSEKPLLPSQGLRYGIGIGAGLLAFFLIFVLLRFVAKSTPIRLGVALVVGGVAGGFATFAILTWVPSSLPIPIFNRLGNAFWEIAGEAGIKTTAIRMPNTFPSKATPNVKLLAGLGIPDVRQTNGTYTMYSSEKEASGDTEMGGRLVPVSVLGDRVESKILGPKNFTMKDKPGVKSLPDTTAPFTVKIDRASKSAQITVQGVTQRVEMGKFSDFFTVEFTLNPLLKLQGIAKFALIAIEPEFRLYLTPVNFNPAKMPPNVRISNPANFSAQLAGANGLYKTLGWQEETWALNELQITEELFLDDLYRIMGRIEKIIVSELEKKDSRLFVGVFEGTDRLQHMFWRYWDEKHPLYDSTDAQTHLGEFSKMYREVDRIIGVVMNRFVDDDTLFMVVSDHGFQSFRKAVNINTWLVENGFMTLKGQENVRDRNLDDLFGQGEFWPNVDWSRTKAYHLGLGQVYINLFDREPEGSVMKTDYEALQNELRQKMLAFLDPEDGTPVFKDVYRRQDIYKGPAYDFAPDIILGFNEGYRVSWQSSLGGIPKGLIAPNDRKWSGDHCSVDPSLTAGIIFTNRKVTKAEPSIFDIAPTVLQTFSLKGGDDIDGKPLF
ncbi:MAG: alkaline phosphatase family protein [Deltaproteobacteria bacterium]|nr:alkaline phosphatase family protein [Deltaproteobacteria bacterium]